MINHFTAGLLGRHVRRGAHQHAALRQAGIIGGAGQTEVGELYALLAVEQNIRGFDVPMNESLRMGGGKSGGDLGANAENFREVQGCAAVESLLQRPAGHIMHHQERQAGRFVNGVNGNDVVMTDCRGRPAFAHKALVGAWARCQARR